MRYYLIITSTVIIVLTAYVCCKNRALTSTNDVMLLSSIVKTFGSERFNSDTHFSIARCLMSSGKSGSGFGGFFYIIKYEISLNIHKCYISLISSLSNFNLQYIHNITINNSLLFF